MPDIQQLFHKNHLFVQSYRKDNDDLFFNIVNPHFTIVFPVFDISEEEFTGEVKNKSANSVKFDFVIRCATINKDAFKIKMITKWNSD